MSLRTRIHNSSGDVRADRSCRTENQNVVWCLIYWVGERATPRVSKVTIAVALVPIGHARVEGRRIRLVGQHRDVVMTNSACNG